MQLLCKSEFNLLLIAFSIAITNCAPTLQENGRNVLKSTAETTTAQISSTSNKFPKSATDTSSRPLQSISQQRLPTESLHSVNFAALEDSRYRQSLDIHRLTSDYQRLLFQTKVGFEDVVRKFHLLDANTTISKEESQRDRLELINKLTDSNNNIEKDRNEFERRISALEGDYSSLRKLLVENKMQIDSELNRIRQDSKNMELGTNIKLKDLGNSLLDHVSEINTKITSLVMLGGNHLGKSYSNDLWSVKF